MPRATVEGGASDWSGGTPQEAPAAEQPAVEVPSVRALKSELIEHAVQVAGLDPDAAAALTKADLVETIAAAVPPPPPPPGN